MATTGLVGWLIAAALCQSAESTVPSGRPETSTDGNEYWQWGVGLYYAGVHGRWTELDAARADWLLLRCPDLPANKETAEGLNRLLKLNPRLKFMMRVWPMHDYCPHKGALTYNMPTGLGSRMMYDYFFSPGVKEKVLADTRRQVRAILDHIDKPENVVGMTMMEEAPQFISDMGIFMKDGETNWAIEAYRKEIEADYGKPFVWNEEARRWWCQKYVQIHDEIHAAMKEASVPGTKIFYWQQTGYINLDHLPADSPQDPFGGEVSNLIPIHLADIIKPGRCDGIFGYANAGNWERDTLRFARERGWPFWSQVSHPCFMRNCKWEECLELAKVRMPQNLGFVFFCSGSCAAYPKDPNPTTVDETIPIHERTPYTPPLGDGWWGPYQIEHIRRFLAQQNVGMDIVERNLVPELAFDYTIDAGERDQTTRVLLQVHNTKDPSWYLDPQQAVLRGANVRLLLPAGVELVAGDHSADVTLKEIEAGGYRVVSWPVRVKKGTTISKDHPLEARVTAANCPNVTIASYASDVTIPPLRPVEIWSSGQSWVEPTYRVRQSHTPELRIRALQGKAINPSLTVGAATVRYDGTLSAGQELLLSPGRPARLVPSNLIVGDLSVLRDPAGPHEAKGFSQGHEVFSLRMMNPAKPGTKLRVTISGKVAGGAVSMIRLSGFKLPASYHTWISEPILVGRLTEQWQDAVSQEIVLPPEADVRQVVGYRQGEQGTIWYGDVAVTLADEPEDGIDVSEQVRGELPTLPVLPTAEGGQVQQPLRVTYHDDSEPSIDVPRLRIHMTAAAP